MSTSVKKIIFLGISFLTFSSLMAVPHHHSDMMFEQKATVDYSQLKFNMDKTIYLLEQKGDEAIPEIQKIDTNNDNFGGIYVVDPETGKLLASPNVTDNKESLATLKFVNVNGKALAREAIKKWQQSRNQGWWNDLSDMLSVKHMEFITNIAVTTDGKVYVVAIGKDDLSLQRLFVKKIVTHASNLLKDIGTEEAYKIFSDKDSKYKYNSKAYIYVYSDKGVCLYNPNYPELEGKDATVADPAVKEMIEVAETQGSGWLKCEAKVPGQKELGKKEIYFQSVFKDGKTYIVGSGVYVNSK